TFTGLSISTLRRWADEGRLPSYRTQGGHRRFRLDDLQRALLPQPSAAEAMDVFDALATSRIRRQLGAPRTRELDWLAGIDDAARERLRLLGRHLLTTIEDYLAARRPRATVLAEARQFGLMYGRELASAGFSVRQGMEAFTFFRRSVEEAARRYSAKEGLGSERLEDLRDQLDALNDRLLLGIAEAFDTPQRQAVQA
ncbi:MAG TPA: helix-turn-helix domain-containing protein, partial [Dehalococcoidia bacterium]|nr:helix-turn-helix domain-containing protein [Dehalococcoidia bacterium]